MVGIVTGGSKGIGLAIARAFLERGMQVAISARKDAELAGRGAPLGAGRRASPSARTCAIRPTRSGSSTRPCAASAASTSSSTTPASASSPNVADMSLDDWRQTIDTNLSGVFYCSRAAIPAMKARGAGFIINISSLAGKNPFTGGAAYCASKAGLNAFSEALMQEVRHDNIRVSYVMPGSVSTGIRRSRLGWRGRLETDARGRGAGGRRSDRARRPQPAEPRRAPAVTAAQEADAEP